MVDLWADEEEEDQEEEAQQPLPLEEEELPKLQEGEVRLKLQEESLLEVLSGSDLSLEAGFEHFLGLQRASAPNPYRYLLPLRAVNAYRLRYLLRGKKVEVVGSAGTRLGEEADKLPLPTATLAESGRQVAVSIPPLEEYKSILKAVNGRPLKDGVYHVALTKALDLEALAATVGGSLPQMRFSKSFKQLSQEPLPGFDGTLESLKSISIGELHVVKANSQSYKAVKASKKTLEEKLQAFGLATCFDLLSWLPKRYIDKSKPQDIHDLVVDEAATVIGTVSGIESLPNSMGVAFIIETASGRTIRTCFWRQDWLRNKFPVGTEVLVTGKFGFFNRKPQLNGSSIEHAREASTLPIVPVYKQSESRGITTSFLLAAERELFSRLGPIALPAYLQREGRLDYYEAFKELHLPSSLEHHSQVIDSLAYYELVKMQLLMQEAKERSLLKPGLSQREGPRKLQAKAVAALPFTLTKSQQEAVEDLNRKLADGAPSSTLLNAEVGSGKTIVAQLACLRAVEAGFQAVLIGPTEVLARQLFATFQKLQAGLASQGEDLRLEYLGGGMKAAERKKLLAAVKSGEVDVLVGTHSIISDTVEYSNLGFVAVDEQQKFGAQQRSKLLNSREDGSIPDLLMQTATPIPRSTAQVFYGDVDMLMLTEKPPGRLPIITEWLQEDPQELLSQAVSPLWTSIEEAAALGNQTFVITPMVRDSTTVDAASVERSHKQLSEVVLPHLRVGFVHGQMKKEEQEAAMEAFRRKEYDVLVASTVVEVGVDIPDATHVVVLSADRLGASSLHQIRGRVGRNSKQSYCYLVSLGRTENAQLRLQSLVDSENGFEVAKADLAVRGEGTMFGSDQSGASEMMFASLSRHGKWVKQAREEALEVLASPLRRDALEDSRQHFAAEGRLV